MPSGATASGLSPRVLVSKGRIAQASDVRVGAIMRRARRRASRRGRATKFLRAAAACYDSAMDASLDLTPEQTLDEFRAAGALLEGHFILSSGLRSPVFLQKMRSSRTRRAPSGCAGRWRRRRAPPSATIDVVASPAVGGIIPGYETARWLGAKAIFVEREDGVFKLRRGFAIAPGARVLMVEDVITTGLSSRECLAALAEHPGRIVGAACLVDRSGGKADIGVPRVALATLDIPAYPADALPPELAAIPAVKPGSRALGRGGLSASNQERTMRWLRCVSGSTSIMSPPCATRAAARFPIRCARRSSPSKPAPTASPRICARTAATSTTTTCAA